MRMRFKNGTYFQSAKETTAPLPPGRQTSKTSFKPLLSLHPAWFPKKSLHTSCL